MYDFQNLLSEYQTPSFKIALALSCLHFSCNHTPKLPALSQFMKFSLYLQLLICICINTLNHTQATSSKAIELHGYKDILHIKLNIYLSHIFIPYIYYQQCPTITIIPKNTSIIYTSYKLSRLELKTREKTLNMLAFLETFFKSEPERLSRPAKCYN